MTYKFQVFITYRIQVFITYKLLGIYNLQNSGYL
jgi:hypothetical protein